MLGGAAQVQVVGEAHDGRGCCAAVDRHHPDVVLMDIRMPRLDGIATTRLLRTQPSPPRIIVLTTFDADELVLRSLQAGAAGFLLKDTAPADIVAAIEAVHAGEGSLSPAIARRLIALVAGDPDDGRPARAGTAPARLAHPARAPGSGRRRRGTLQRRHRRPAARQPRDRQGTRLPAAGQARRRQPGPDRAARAGRRS